MNSPPDEGERTENGERTEYLGVGVSTRVNAAMRHPAQWVFARATRRRGVHRDVAVPTSAQDALDRLTALRISTWSYGFDHKSIRHLGPMAQDFAAVFGLGSNTRRISAVDANGVCMASIQALNRKIGALETKVSALEKDLGILRTEMGDTKTDRNTLEINNNHKSSALDEFGGSTGL
ncbi:tail fiber domain-containing protein [Rhodococcus erythropolis]|uniref:tail fiber domain-containing protein n=1 Tax=Rhodococcus erythropolis TaxID=1833 RepID=UPI002948E8A6|nr:tail fiber domain-containing protein [Rhodococcus erythropolis]MDV6275048.1 tail fiber domain-containing protein [Rhodococcus erythropolis]